MTTMPLRITAGVDTHLDVHVAALDHRGGLLGVESFATTPEGYRALLGWLRGFGEVELAGVEGTGSYGTGLARNLHSEGVRVVEVDRPNRQRRRRRGKSDPQDAIAAARAAQSGDARGEAKTRNGNVEAMRVLRVARSSARKARTQALNQMRSLVSTAPDAIRAELRHLNVYRLLERTSAYRPGPGRDLASLTKRTLRMLVAHKTWMASRPGRRGGPMSPTTISHRLCLLRTFFERIIDWDYDDAPRRCPIYKGDFPERDEPLPKFLDDPTAAKFMAALATDPNKRRRLMVELLARTGMRAGELSALASDAMVRIGDTHWLRIPVGKLHNDRYVPLHPLLVDLINDWLATRPPSRSGRLVERNDGKPFDRRTIHRYVAAAAKRAGVGHVHPHQLRHTLATQAINRGMSLEAIAALLGHRSMRMTLTYARISDRTIADEYFRVTEAVETSYRNTEPMTADVEAPNMRRLAADHRRLLGNGHCTRPAALDCTYETICERCGFFETGPQFVPILRRQHDHATDNDQHDRAQLFTQLLDTIDDNS